MRTKSLLLAAVISAAGLATSMAQVYSVNIVGYKTMTLPAGKLSMIANPLVASTNTIASLFASLPEGSQIFRFTSAGTYTTLGLDFGVWGPPAEASKDLLPGEGIFVRIPAGPDATLTFVGDVMLGSMTNNLPKGLSIRASQVPQLGSVTALGLVAGEGDQIFKWNVATQNYSSFSFDFGAWGPTVPSLDVAEAAFFNKVTAGTWTRTFTSN